MYPIIPKKLKGSYIFWPSDQTQGALSNTMGQNTTATVLLAPADMHFGLGTGSDISAPHSTPPSQFTPLMSLLIRYAHIPFYFHFSFTFPTSPIHPYAPPLRRDCAHARTTIALALSDQSRLFDGHMTYDSHVFTSILSVSNVPPPAVRPITRSRTAWSGTFYSFTICSHSCLPFVFNLPVFTFRQKKHHYRSPNQLPI